MAMIAACVLEPGEFFAINTKGAPAEVVAKISAAGFPVTEAGMQQLATNLGETTMFGRAGGAPTFAVGMAHMFARISSSPTALALWYHFAIMFEALFILTAVDAGTRVGRFMLQDTVGNVWPKFGDTSWKPASWTASAVVVVAWGYMLYVGVTDPLGGINQLFPLFGIANQLLAAIALTLCVTLFCKHGWWKYVWVPAVPLAWDLVVTMTASYQKVLSENPAIGYFAQADLYREARDAGEVLAPATDAGQMDTVISNSMLNGFLQASFAVLVIVIVANAVVIWVKAAKVGTLPTHEVPKTESRIVAPADFFATEAEKRAMAEQEASREAKVGS